MNAEKPVLWRSMPPAVFPSILGLTGLAATWLAGGPLIGAGKGVGYVILLLALLVYTVFATAYLRKFLARPGVFVEDLGSIPGRIGLATMMIVLLLMASGMIDLSRALATGMVFAGLVGLGLVSVGATVQLLRAPKEQRQITAAWHLTFVGYVVGAPALARLNYDNLTLIVAGVTFFLALGIYGASIEQSRATPLPDRMRPINMIHIAPISLFGTTAALLHLPGTAMVIGWVATVLALVLLIRLPFFMRAGFTPFWGSFTFPVAAYAILMLTLHQEVTIFKWIGITLMLAMTAYVPLIVGRVLRMCLDGRLAKVTNPATA